MELGDMLQLVELRLDYWSIGTRLNEVEWFPREGGKKGAYVEYEEQLLVLSRLSAELYADLNRLTDKLNDSIRLPLRTLVREGLVNCRGIAWFDMAASILTETDLSILLEHEGCYDPDHIADESGRRRRAILALTKENLFLLLTETFHILTRYIKIEQTFEAVCCAADELECQRRSRGQASAPKENRGKYEDRS